MLNEENSLVINEILQRVGLEPIGPSIRKLPMNRKLYLEKKKLKKRHELNQNLITFEFWFFRLMD